jgi:hypothetical protein
MAYRGDDLDLRIPQAAPGDLAITQPPVMGDLFSASQRSRSGTQRAAPIWVDDTVLDCCNHAYDVASAHRAAEVRIEHLVYALTRIEEAVDALEARGARVAALRREAAAVIATEIPTSNGNGKTNPRRAEAFEEVLRLAAAHAYRRQAPVAVSDILYALLDSGMEFASLIRLLPSAPPRPMHHAPEASLDVEAVRDRIRNGPLPQQSSRGLTADLASLSAAQVATQHSRIDAMEHSIRTLTTELANERKILSGVLQDLQRELMAQREDTSRLGGITQDKFQAVFGDRLQSLEQAFLSSRHPAGSGVEALEDRLGLLERALQAEISVTRSAVEALGAKPAQDLAPLLGRLDTMEEGLAAERQRAKADEQALAAAIQSVSESLGRQPDELTARISTPLMEHLGAQHATTTDGLAEANRRLQALEEAFAAHVARAEAAEGQAAQERSALRETLDRLVEGVGREADASREALGRLTENLTQDLSELHDGLSKLGANQNVLVDTLDSEARDIAHAIAAIAGRVEGLEKASAKPVEMLSALSATVEKMHTVTIEKYYRRNRFWYWLFGTDDWLAASWPSQSRRIADELRSLKH